MEPPTYFESIRQESAKRWATLEADPVLAAPWRQLFRQIQSPRHVVSELLQNAEDAGATTARVALVGDDFIFSHDGSDFTSENFESLCRFGYSDKKALHTIGFRGLGFKSTFSLGDTVQLSSPSLSVAFERERFTEPCWVTAPKGASGTEVRVRLKDDNRGIELDRNLGEWASSPYSLLFFQNLRTLEIGEETVHWEDLGPGPIARSRWLRLLGGDDSHLVLRSEPEEFPDDALAEIREERGAPDDFVLPPCEVAMVLGADGRLFVVLPTGVRTDLPFAVNAPFMQDPTRTGILDPSVSPTNRWLLDRVGRLAAEAMLSWLGNESLALEERANAYDLFPVRSDSSDDLGTSCQRRVVDAFMEAIGPHQEVLGESGELVFGGGAIVLPSELFEVWDATEISDILGVAPLVPVARAVSDENLQKLIESFDIPSLSAYEVAEKLIIQKVPKPATWGKLVLLWAFMSRELSKVSWNARRNSVHLVPIPGSKSLYPSREIVKLGKKRLLNREEDWQFLNEHARVLDANWTRYLSDKQRRLENDSEEELATALNDAGDLLMKLGLGEASSPSEVFTRFVKRFAVEGSDQSVETWVRIAEMGAALGASAPGEPIFVTRDCRRRLGTGLIYDPDGTDAELHPQDWVECHILHSLYARERQSCSVADWERWTANHLTKFPSPVEQHRYVGRGDLEGAVRSKGYGGPIRTYYSYPSFRLHDWNFEEAHWNHWTSMAEADEGVWARVVERLLASRRPRPEQWSCLFVEVASNGRQQAVFTPGTRAAWIVKFGQLACLRDNKGFLRKPAELLCFTPETSAVFGVVPFVDPTLDTAGNREVLVALGVGTRPNGTDHLLRRLRALSAAQQPPLLELCKLYEALDGVVAVTSVEEHGELKELFGSERLIYTGETGWRTSDDCFVHADETDVPGAPLVPAEVRDLQLWVKLGVPQRPTPEMALAWLSALPRNAELSAGDLRRVRALQTRYPVRVWMECGVWQNLNSRLAATDDLKYSFTMQAMASTANLFPWVRDQTANFRDLPVTVTAFEPFSGVPTLSASLEERLSKPPVGSGDEVVRPWMWALGNYLARIRLDDGAEEGRVRMLGRRLGQTAICRLAALRAEPFLGGMPAGTPRPVPAMWRDHSLFVQDLPSPQLVKPVSDELGRPFDRPELIDAIKLCYERDDSFVSEYLEANFEFDEAEEQSETLTVADLPHSPFAGFEPIVVSADVSGGQPLIGSAIGQAATEQASPDVEPGEEAAPSEPNADSDGAGRSTSVDPLPVTPKRPVAPQPPKPQAPSLMERFASSLGYTKRDADLFEGPNGEILCRERGELFPWQQHGASTELVQYYWSSSTDLDREPLQVPSSVWHLLQERPENHHFVLEEDNGQPSVLRGGELIELVASQVILLFPVDYRLVKQGADKS